MKQAGFRVLVTAFMPAVLVEIGFGTNPAEAAYLTDPAQDGRAVGRRSPTPCVEYLEALRAPRRRRGDAGERRERSRRQ